MADKETTVVSTGGAGWFVAGIVLVVALIGGYFLFGGEVDTDKADIEIDLTPSD